MSRSKVDVFVSLGTHPQPFPRLLNEVARLIDLGKLKGKVLVQAGYTTYSHPQMEIVDFLPIETFEETLSQSKLFITHAGEGNIGQAILSRVPLVIVPRQMELGEHTDNHQDELARAMSGQYGVAVISNIRNLEEGIKIARAHAVEKTYMGYIPRILAAFAREKGFEIPKGRSNIPFQPPKSASIVVATLNGGQPLIRAIRGMLNQDYKGKYEVIVVDDGSFDGETPTLLKKNFSTTPDVKLVFLSRSGVSKARNAGIHAAQHEVVVNMDHDDNPEKEWLKTMMSGFDSPNVGAVSAYGHYGGTSTAFRKDLLDHLGGYDENFFYYREDTDLSFRIMELGFEYRKVSGAKWHGDRTLVTPKGIGKLLRYTFQRFTYHMNDVLLHKKHPTRLCEDFLHVKGAFFVDPVEDFKVATGLWQDSEKEPVLSSPRGMTFLSNQGIFSFGLIVLAGLAYAGAIKWARLAGSLKHMHLLV